MDILLIAGLWLDASAWDDVIGPLEAHGHHAVPVALPGQGDGRTSATLADQVAAVVAAVDSADGRPMVVGHSAAASLAWIAADRRPDKVGKTALIGGFPNPDGESYADFFPTENGAMPFPGWEPFEGPDSADLDEATKQRIAADGIPVPEGVPKAAVTLTDERRFAVPTVLVCPEFTPDDAKEWIAAGELPELEKAQHVSFVDIDSGHWPMFSVPEKFAAVLAEAAT